MACCLRLRERALPAAGKELPSPWAAQCGKHRIRNTPVSAVGWLLFDSLNLSVP